MQQVLADYTAAHPEDEALLADLEESVGKYRLELCEYPAAEKALRSALKHVLATLGPEHSTSGAIHRLLGRLATETEQFDVAEAELSLALEIAKRWGKEHSGNLLATEASIARLKIAQGRPDEAIEILASVAQRAGQSGNGVRQDVHALRLLTKAYQRKGMLQEAIANAEQAVESAKQSHGPDNLLTHLARIELADLHRQIGKTSQAWTVLNEPAPVNITQVGVDHPHYASLLRLKGLLWLHDGNHEAAHEALTQALTIRERVYGKQGADTNRLRLELAAVSR